jgi:glucosyl-3-phosphoglycerate synthase
MYSRCMVERKIFTTPPELATMEHDPYRNDPEMRYRLDGDFTVPFLRDVASYKELLRKKQEKGLNIILVIPTKNEGGRSEAKPGGNIGETLHNLMPLKQLGLVDQIKVIDSDSTDDTVAIAREKGADVLIASEHTDKLGSEEYTPGKGTNLRIAMAEHQNENDLLIFCDADFAARESQIQGVISPLIENDSTQMSLAWMTRETQQGDASAPPRQGGRATEAGFKPMMRLLYPELEGLQQPICGLYAMRGSAARQCEVPPDYRVETALLTQVAHLYRSDEAFAQTFCGTKRQTGQSADRINIMIQQILHQGLSSAYIAERPLQEPTEIISYPTYRDENGITVIRRVVEPYGSPTYPPVARTIFPN